MKLSISAAVAGLAALTCANAYKVTGGSVTSKKVEVARLTAGSTVDTTDRTKEETPELPIVEIETARDSFVVTVDFEKAPKPSQLLFLLSGSDDGLEHSIYGRFVETASQASVSIVANKLPNVLMVQESIKVSIVAASGSEEEENVVVPLFSFSPSEQLQSTIEYVKPSRLGAVHEIYHQFRTEEATIGTSLPIIFSAGAIGLLVVLIGAWVTILNGDMFKGCQGSLYKIGYLATLGYFEFVVLQYYLGTSIFATIFQAALVAAPMSFFGSRALTSLARLRK